MSKSLSLRPIDSSNMVGTDAFLYKHTRYIRRGNRTHVRDV